MKKKFLVKNVDNIFLYAKHQVLRELALLISKNIDLHTNKRINVFIGIHHWTTDFLPKNSINIGIQSEQFFDANGTKLWGYSSIDHLKIACLKFDVILDFSEFNKIAYQKIDKYNIVEFGPYIFPKEKYIYKKNKRQEICFVGALNDRRKRIISEISQLHAIKIITNEFGGKLSTILEESNGVLNIHYQDGVYAEWPRILLAYMSGKVLFSEDLGLPLIKGKHYFDLDFKTNGSDPGTLVDNLWIDIAKKYSFSDFIFSHNLHKINIEPIDKCHLFLMIIAVHLKRFIGKFRKVFGSK